MKRISKFFFRIGLFIFIITYLLLFLFSKDIISEVLILVNKEIKGSIEVEEIELDLLSSFPFPKIEAKEVTGILNNEKVAEFKNISIDINIWRLLLLEITLDKIRGANGYINFTKGSNFLDIFKPNKRNNNRVKLKVGIGDIYVYNSNIENKNILAYVEKGKYTFKKVNKLKRIYIVCDGKLSSNYNIPFKINSIIKLKDSISKIEGETKIFEYKFKNEGNFILNKKWFNNFKFSLASDFNNVKTLSYDNKKKILIPTDKGKGHFKMRLDFINDKNKFSINSYIKSKNVDINVGKTKVFKKLNSNITFSYIDSIKKLNIKEFKANDNIDIKGIFNKTIDKYSISLKSKTYIPKEVSKYLFNKEIDLNTEGDLKLDISNKDFKINKSEGQMSFKIKEIFINDDYKLSTNILFKDGIISTEKGILQNQKENYNIKVSKINIIPYLVSSNNGINGKLLLSKNNFKINTDFSYFSNNLRHSYRLSNFNIDTDIYSKITNKKEFNIYESGGSLKTNKSSLIFGKSQVNFSIDKNKNITLIKLNSKEGNLTDIFKINSTFYLPKKLKNTNYKDLKVEISFEGDSILNIKNVSFISNFLDDKVEIKGSITRENKDIFFNNIKSNIGSTDLDIKEEKGVISINSKYFDYDLFRDKKVEKESNFKIKKIELPEKNLIISLKTLNYRDNIFNNIEGTGLISKKEITDIKINGEIAKGNFLLLGEFKFKEENDISFLGNLNIKNIKLEKLDLRLEGDKIKDNFEGKLYLASNINLKFKNNLDILWERSLIKNEIIIEKGKLIKYKPLSSIDKYFKKNSLDTISFNRIETKMMIYDNQLIIPKTEIPSTIGHMYISANLNFKGDKEYTVFLPMNLFRTISWRAFFGIKKKDDKKISNQVKEKYNGSYKEINIIETDKELKVKL